MSTELSPLQASPEQFPNPGDEVLTGRSNKTVEPAQYFGKLGDKHYVVLSEVGPDGKQLLRDITPEALSPEGQKRLARLRAEQLGTEPARSRVTEAVASSAVGSSLGESPFDMASVGSPEMAARVQLKPENIDRAMNEIDHALGGRLGELLRRRGDIAMIREALDPNTGDRRLRTDVEEVLRLGIDELGGGLKLPERVQRNDPNDLKAVPAKRFGHEKSEYPPRDYAARLALAVLDGSFDGDVRKLDYSDIPSDDPRNGQHRQAARMVLDYYADQKPQTVVYDAEVTGATKAEQGIDEEIRHSMSDIMNELKALVEKANQSNLSSETKELGVDIGRVADVLDVLRRRIVNDDLSTVEERTRREDVDYELGRATTHLSIAQQAAYDLMRQPSQATAIRQELEDRLQQAERILSELLNVSL